MKSTDLDFNFPSSTDQVTPLKAEVLLAEYADGRRHFNRVDLRECDLSRSKLSMISLEESILQKANLSGSNLAGSTLNHIDLFSANLTNVNLIAADLVRARLTGANLAGAVMSGANLSGANLRKADLTNCTFAGANLSGVDFSGAILKNVNLGGANLKGANLRNVDLTNIDLNNVDLDETLLPEDMAAQRWLSQSQDFYDNPGEAVPGWPYDGEPSSPVENQDSSNTPHQVTAEATYTPFIKQGYDDQYHPYPGEGSSAHDPNLDAGVADDIHVESGGAPDYSDHGYDSGEDYHPSHHPTHGYETSDYVENGDCFGEDYYPENPQIEGSWTPENADNGGYPAEEYHPDYGASDPYIGDPSATVAPLNNESDEDFVSPLEPPENPFVPIPSSVADMDNTDIGNIDDEALYSDALKAIDAIAMGITETQDEPLDSPLFPPEVQSSVIDTRETTLEDSEPLFSPFAFNLADQGDDCTVAPDYSSDLPFGAPFSDHDLLTDQAASIEADPAVTFSAEETVDPFVAATGAESAPEEYPRVEDLALHYEPPTEEGPVDQALGEASVETLAEVETDPPNSIAKTFDVTENSSEVETDTSDAVVEAFDSVEYSPDLSLEATPVDTEIEDSHQLPDHESEPGDIASVNIVEVPTETTTDSVPVALSPDAYGEIEDSTPSPLIHPVDPQAEAESSTSEPEFAPPMPPMAKATPAANSRVVQSIQSVLGRRVQYSLQRKLLDIYHHQCAITGCDIQPLLETVFISSHDRDRADHPSQCLVLRSDLKVLYDLKLLAIHPHKLTVLLSPHLLGSDYSRLQGHRITVPEQKIYHPSSASLTMNLGDCSWYDDQYSEHSHTTLLGQTASQHSDGWAWLTWPTLIALGLGGALGTMLMRAFRPNPAAVPLAANSTAAAPNQSQNQINIQTGDLRYNQQGILLDQKAYLTIDQAQELGLINDDEVPEEYQRNYQNQRYLSLSYLADLGTPVQWDAESRTAVLDCCQPEDIETINLVVGDRDWPDGGIVVDNRAYVPQEILSGLNLNPKDISPDYSIDYQDTTYLRASDLNGLSLTVQWDPEARSLVVGR